MNLLSFSDRLAFALEHAGKKPVDLANALDVSRAAISQLLSGASKGMKPEHLVAAARYLGVRIEWLATGELPMQSRCLSARHRQLLDYADELPPEALDAVLHLLSTSLLQPRKAA